MDSGQILIVLAALMALISAAAIAIDWVGKPLRGRPFTPKMYRYPDEYRPARTPKPQRVSTAATRPAADSFREATFAPPPTVARGVPKVTSDSNAVPADPWATEEAPAPSRPVETSTFSDALETDAGTWGPGQALNATIAGITPTVDEKASRFWKSMARSAATAYLDDEQHERMGKGKPPTRKNPITGRVETMELVGLRSASSISDVNMRWPGKSVDPWGRQ